MYLPSRVNQWYNYHSHSEWMIKLVWLLECRPMTGNHASLDLQIRCCTGVQSEILLQDRPIQLTKNSSDESTFIGSLIVHPNRQRTANGSLLRPVRCSMTRYASGMSDPANVVISLFPVSDSFIFLRCCHLFSVSTEIHGASWNGRVGITSHSSCPGMSRLFLFLYVHTPYL